jgi:hypothetical protein
VANIRTYKFGDGLKALLIDRPRPSTGAQFKSFKSELAWKFCQWVAQDGIIITNAPVAQLDETPTGTCEAFKR